MENEREIINTENTLEARTDEAAKAVTEAENPASAESTDEKKKRKKRKGKGGIKALAKSRRLRHGSVAIAITAVVIAITVAVNIIVGLLVDRFPNLKVDFTANQAYALQSDTSDYLGNLKKDITLYILSTKSSFEANGEYFVQAKNLIEKMQTASNGKLKVEYVDTASNPNFTSKYKNIDWTSKQIMAIVECGEQYKALMLEDCFTYDEEYAQYGYYQYTSTTIEQAVVTAALYVTTDDKVVVDILTDNQPGEYDGLKALLTKNAFKVNEISLITKDIDKDAQFVVLFAPAVDLDESQVDKISKWLENDKKYGRTLLYVASSEPGDKPNLEALLNDWGMSVNKGFVFETDPNHLQNGANPYTFIADYTDLYKEGLKNPDIPVIVNYSHGIEIKDSSKAAAILNTSDRAGIQPYDTDEKWDYNDAVKGSPIAIAAQGSKASGDNTSRLIVFSGDRMLLQAFMQYNSFNNAGFVMNIFNSVADKDDSTITIDGKSLESAELGITDVSSTTAVLVIFVIIIPLGIIVLGIVLWLIRRNK